MLLRTFYLFILPKLYTIRGGSRAAATSKMECFEIIVYGWKPLTIITKHSILDVAAGLDPPLTMEHKLVKAVFKTYLQRISTEYKLSIRT